MPKNLSGFIEKQGRIHGNPVADGWAGAVMQKPLAIQQGRIYSNVVPNGWAGAVVRKPLDIQKFYKSAKNIILHIIILIII